MPLENEKRNSFMADRKAFPEGVFFKKTTLIMKKFDTFRVEKEELTPIRI